MEKYIFHHHVRARYARGRLLTLEFRLGDKQTRAYGVAMAHGAQVDLRNRRNRGQCLAAEAHGVESIEVGGRGNLAGGMTLESHAGVGGRHAAAIIDNLYQGAAGVLEDYRNGCGSGVYGILHELFDYRGRALDNLARSYLVGHRIRQQFYHIIHKAKIQNFARIAKFSCLLIFPTTHHHAQKFGITPTNSYLCIKVSQSAKAQFV